MAIVALSSVVSPRVTADADVVVGGELVSDLEEEAISSCVTGWELLLGAG